MRIAFALTIAASLLPALTGCGLHRLGGDLGASASSSQTASIPSDITHLEVDNGQGYIHVMGTDKGDAHWNLKLTVRAKTDDIAQRIAGAIKCESTLSGGHLKLRIIDPAVSDPHSIESDFEIFAPKSSGLVAHTHFGDLDVNGLTQDVEVTDQNGDVDIRNVPGKVRAQTSFGSLSVADTGAADLLDQNGTVEAAQINGPVTVKTSFGSLVAKQIHGPASLANQNGEVKANAIAGRLEINTTFGGITVFDVSGSARIRNQNGSVEAVQIKGDVDISTSFDGLSVDRIGGTAHLANRNGGIFANGIAGAVRAETAFAAIEIKGAGPEFICHDQNGAIRLRATSAALTNIEAKTSFGLLELHLPTAARPELVAQTSFGDVQSDFPVLARGEEPAVHAGVLRAELRDQNGNIRVYRD